METLHPDTRAWQHRAACSDADPNLFDWKDATDLGVHHTQVKAANLASFTEALTYCDSCPVVDACLSEALVNGDHVWSVRGGRTPYDHEGAAPGRLGATGPGAPERTLLARSAAFKAFLEGVATTQFSGHVKDWLKSEKERLTAGPETAFWDFWRPPSGRGQDWPAGGGWVVSQDVTRSVVLVLVRQVDGSLKRRLANSRYVRYDSTIVPRLLKEWPEGMDLPLT